MQSSTVTAIVLGYTGYGDGVGTDLVTFIDTGMRSDWAANREALLAFRKSGQDDGRRLP